MSIQNLAEMLMDFSVKAVVGTTNRSLLLLDFTPTNTVAVVMAVVSIVSSNSR